MVTENNNVVQKRLVAPFISGLGGFILILVLGYAQSLLNRGGGTCQAHKFPCLPPLLVPVVF